MKKLLIPLMMVAVLLLWLFFRKNTGSQQEADFAVQSDSIYDLALRKTVLDEQWATYLPGGEVTFLIEVFNQGDEVSGEVVVLDYLHPALTFVASSLPNATVWSSNGREVTFANVPVWGSVVVELTYSIADDFAWWDIVNTAEIIADTWDDHDSVIDITPNSENDCHTDDEIGLAWCSE